MPVIRTPEERFENLPDYPFKPNYVEVNGLRMHYVDEGEGEVVLCLHGEPTWSYLYRKMIPILAKKHRVIVPDHIGFGKSDKYTEHEKYSYKMHVDQLVGFIEALDLKNITAVMQDWGGLIGLRVAAEHGDRFARLVVMNTGLPAGNLPPEAASGFMTWRKFAEQTPDLPIDAVIRMGVKNGGNLKKEVIAAYCAPFPDVTYKAGAATFPLLVPVRPDDPGAKENIKAASTLSKWDKPVLVMFSDSDPITKGGDIIFKMMFKTAKNEPDIMIKDAGHFLQEDKGEELAGHILEFTERNPL